MDIFALGPAEWQAIRLSLWVALWAVAGSLGPAIAVAWILARLRFPGKTLLDGLVHLPLVVPPVVTGYLLLVILGRRGVVGSWLHDVFGLNFMFDWKGAAVASAVVAFPLMVRAIRQSVEAVDVGLEQAARTLGAGRWRVFLTIILPLALPGVLAGLVLAFARGLGEFGATITFVSNIPGQTRTLPLALYSALQAPGGEEVAARLCVVAMVLALGALLASELLSRRLAARLGG
ncbi:molybdate ABC transporter, inner membrane subunit [Desulfarculus baarsii DSM 2075]|uniref:Molybdenum transport system permease n=1 Tax=Desulfarculus baarsii (strain ATCC 33931 / DSM 2075 / LMG 7858 / VKM B-1802 / 2st14) TaxID=644282 RepID=E1QG26_DESB2|nr:molybdate ABC transporter permease subunit [Desulfarculus baarsii]ADK84636.1 molybdate ABC transporter, inner membrane subunit [Desulfarculus baarsii DSM 2075]